MKQALSPETPVRVRRGQFRAISLGVGASALAMACSFGEIDSPPQFIDIDVPAPPSTPGNTPVDVSGTPSNPVSGPAVNQPPKPAGPGIYDPDNDPFSTEMGKQVRAILDVNCGGCHSGNAAFGNMNYILDMNSLVANEQIYPGDKNDSRIFIRMQQQSMPPAFMQTQRPTTGQIDLVGEFIDSLEPIDAQGCDPLAFMTLDEQIAAMSRDVAGLDVEDQPFTRYLTITYNSNAGGCGRELERQQLALFKGINSVSTEPRVKKPYAIDKDGLIFRIDIRDYNWDREIDLEDNDSIDFADGWDAIVAGSAPYAVEFEGTQADDLKADTDTAVPFMPVNAFIQFTEQGDLYYTLIGARANLFDFEREVLKIDTVVEIAEDNLMRAGFANSGVSKQERVLNRFANGLAANQSYWISFDFDGGNGNGEVNGVSNGFETSVANESIYADPLGFNFAGGEAIFSLPNGLQGYYVAAANGARLAEAPVGVVIDPAQNNGLVVNGASCHSCHQAGMITFDDTVKKYVKENKIQYDNETYESVLEQYPDPAVFKAQMDRDSAMHVNALVEAGVPAGKPDAVTRIYLDFQLGTINAARAAGELGVTEAELLSNLNELNPKLAPLGRQGGYVDRGVFDDTFFESICIMQATSENAPANCVQ